MSQNENKKRVLNKVEIFFDYIKKLQLTPPPNSIIGDVLASMSQGKTDFTDILKKFNETNTVVRHVDQETDRKLRDMICHPSVVIVLGKRGSGKTALGYRILEFNRFKGEPYVFGIPAKTRKLLPDWIGIAKDLADIPNGSILLLDEAQLFFSSRNSLNAKNKEITRIVTLSRQKQLTLVFVSQEVRLLDKNIASQADVIIFKEPGMMQLKYDRSEVLEIAKLAREDFDKIKISSRKKWAYVYSESTNFTGLVEVSLPTFWSNKLSNAFASSDCSSEERLPIKPTKKELIIKAKALYRSGKSYREIAKILGVTVGTAYNYVNNYPYIK